MQEQLSSQLLAINLLRQTLVSIISIAMPSSLFTAFYIGDEGRLWGSGSVGIINTFSEVVVLYFFFQVGAFKRKF